MNIEKIITNDRHAVLLAPDCPYHFFFGDESAIAFFAGLKEQACRMQHQYIGVLEVPDCMAGQPEKEGLLLDIVAHGKLPAENAVRYLSRLEQELWEHWQHGMFYLAAKRAAILAFGNALLERGILPGQLKYFPGNT